MKYLKLALLLAILFVPTITNAQIKKTIGFIPYTDPENADRKYRELTYKNIYDAALRVFINTQRFDVLDRGSFNILKIEKEFQKGEDLANVEIVEQGRVQAAELLAVAKLSSFKITESDDGGGFSVYITAEFKQLDVMTGRATNAFQLRAEIRDKQPGGLNIKGKRISSEEQAISMAVAEMEDDLEKWIKRQFPMILKIVGMNEEDMTVYVDGGSNVGLNLSNDMKLITLDVIGKGENERKLVKTIGGLSYTKEGVGEELTILKVDSKKDWADFKKKWEKDQGRIYVTEDL
ncbi:hypothetical protein CEQ90_05185 [Lewinellaceae bacterium SD302]|nr:hypothetical protein CEQ90_05185 [Lewinellaceae bacterium SD302]